MDLEGVLFSEAMEDWIEYNKCHLDPVPPSVGGRHIATGFIDMESQLMREFIHSVDFLVIVEHLDMTSQEVIAIGNWTAYATYGQGGVSSTMNSLGRIPRDMLQTHELTASMTEDDLH